MSRYLTRMTKYVYLKKHEARPLLTDTWNPAFRMMQCELLESKERRRGLYVKNSSESAVRGDWLKPRPSCRASKRSAARGAHCLTGLF